MRLAAIIVASAACTSPSQPVSVDPGEQGSGSGSGGDTNPTNMVVPDVRCAGTPDAGPALSFNHVSSELIAALGDPRHRGFDLVAPASAATQSIEGWISYTIADKALEDENVDVFACRQSAWQYVGSALTDDEGHFAVALDGTARLPIAMRDLYVSVVGDRTGVGFIGYVAPDDQPLIVSDVDGTLTSSENAFAETIALGGEPDAQPGAPDAYTDAKTRGYQLVYVTSRGGQYTTDTRTWLDDKGFPRGPLRLSPSFLTLPGGDTIDYKTQTIGALALPAVMGIGNRATDVTAYANVGLAAAETFVKLPEYQSELQSDLDGGLAIGVASFDDLRTMYIDALPQR